jgi:hypothetical protein
MDETPMTTNVGEKTSLVPFNLKKKKKETLYFLSCVLFSS